MATYQMQRSLCFALLSSVGIWAALFGFSAAQNAEGAACDNNANSTANTCTQSFDHGTALLQARRATEKKHGLGFKVKYTFTQGIKYWAGTYNGKKAKQWGDLMIPNNVDPPASGFPAFVLIYGNGQKKDHMEWIAKRFIEYDADNSVVCFNPAYSYDREEGLHDTREAVKYLASAESACKKKVCVTLNIDKSKITLYGYSWGGHIVANLILTAPEVLQLLDKVVLASPFIDNEEIRLIATDTSAYKPLLVVHCDPDPACSFSHSKNLFDQIKANGLANGEFVTCPEKWNMKHKSPGHTVEQKAWFDKVVMDFHIGEAAQSVVTPAPTPAGKQCADWCATDTYEWEDKLQWAPCSGCEPPVEPQCLNYCASHTASWQVKFTWKECELCQPAALEADDCHSWCAGDKHAWSEKIYWGKCKGC